MFFFKKFVNKLTKKQNQDPFSFKNIIYEEKWKYDYVDDEWYLYYDTTNDLVSGNLKPENLPEDGQCYSVANHRLFCYQQAILKNTKFTKVPVKIMRETDKNLFLNKKVKGSLKVVKIKIEIKLLYQIGQDQIEYVKNITKRNKEEREKNFEKTGTLCNDIECSYCREHGIKCERSFSRTQKEFEKFKTKVNHINWQFKPTKIKQLHS
ncbi:hypothetical protein C2G38_2231909 [Gigaspora rosea]|uniref:Uncharacterized protein n=1 Tax=Gigaspora rosea TaxID=44941 RepID=A0A397TXF8_9GLOM|nr:hypothetical protein C2G38_2231909 [Gigaspora rosea]